MGKNKPRHNPEKPQNKCGGDGTCPYWDEVGSPSSKCVCEHAYPWDKYCKGNPHNCKKAEYKFHASLRETQDERIR